MPHVRSLRLITFLAELNKLELWGADIGNAYLESETIEKNYIVAGPEFGDRQGKILVIRKALYGLRSSGLCFRLKFAETLRDMGFVPSKADGDVWMRRSGDLYEYVATYVDDLCLVLRDCKAFCDELKEKYNYKLKGDGPITYHLGCNYERDPDGTLKVGPKKYIEKMLESFERMYGEQPKEYSTPLEKGDHPELDTSELCDAKGITDYMHMTGSLQWLISLGRFDVFTATMSMSRYRTAPRLGHLERLKRIYGYVKKMRHGYIRIRTGEPDYSGLPNQDFDWAATAYGEVQELLPDDAPPPLGKRVVLTRYLDATPYHDVVAGRAVTALLHFINQTSFDWYSKRQATVKSATFGSEFVAARTGIDHIVDIRTTLRYLGVPIKGKTYMFGDNESVVKNASVPHSELKKRQMALSYHKTREAIASGMVAFYHIPGKLNPADILSKH